MKILFFLFLIYAELSHQEEATPSSKHKIDVEIQLKDTLTPMNNTPFQWKKYPDHDVEKCLQSFNFFGPSSKPEVDFSFKENFTVFELDESTDAKCLDGSNYKFYFIKGQGSGADKFMINWEGGAFCGVDGLEFKESCLQRSKMFLGSSRMWGENQTIRVEKRAYGYFSSIQEYNPDFWNWNKILIKYCDGSNHQGYVKDPIVVNETNIWFRGYNNTKAALEFAREHLGLFDASEIILSGGSAGGQAVYIWSNYLRSYFPKKIKLLGISDAGLFIDVYNGIAKCRLFRFLNQMVALNTNSKQLDLYRGCPFKNSQIWKCMMAEYLLMEINFPMFVVNSQNDIEALRTQAGVPCAASPQNCSTSEISSIEAFRKKILKLAHFMKITKPTWGSWLRSCFEHVMAGGWGWYGETKNVPNDLSGKSFSLRDALKYWYEHGHKAWFSDSLDWSQNPTCVKK